jgi:4-hydroxy-L-threonine phosphate dehydrogenase PdxA
VRTVQHARARGIEPIVVGDEFGVRDAERVLQAAAARDGGPSDAASGEARAVRVHDAGALPRDAYQPGRLDPRAGRATVAYLAAAVQLHQRGEIDAILACPHSETTINRAGIAFSGYAGLLGELTGTPARRMYLLLVADALRIIHVTVHQGLVEAIASIDTERIVGAVETAHDWCEAIGIAAPRIAVCGINPHAGEDGLFGDEDERLTKPAVAQARALGLDVDGPAGADLLLSQRAHDVYVAMYHDQGHVPIKLLAPLRAAAFSLGAPVRFASVAHGCAFDIAGKGRADARAACDTFDLLVGAAVAR